MQNGESSDRWVRSESARHEATVPLASFASMDDIDHAHGILAIHQPRAVVRRVCSGCGDPWPCVDVLYGWAVTGTLPDGGISKPTGG